MADWHDTDPPPKQTETLIKCNNVLTYIAELQRK